MSTAASTAYTGSSGSRAAPVEHSGDAITPTFEGRPVVGAWGGRLIIGGLFLSVSIATGYAFLRVDNARSKRRRALPDD